MRRFGIWLAAALLLLTACTGEGTDPKPQPAPGTPGDSQPAPPRTALYTAEDVLSALNARGLPTRLGESGMDTDIFQAPYQELVVSGETIRVYLYADAEAAWSAVDLDGCRVWTADGLVDGEPPPDLVCRNLRPGNLIIRMLLPRAALADQIATAILNWAGPGPGETPGTCAADAGRSYGVISTNEFIQELQRAGVEAELTGEWRPGGPGDSLGMVVRSPHGQYLLYPVDLDVPPQRFSLPLHPTGEGATTYLRYGNLLVGLESPTASGVLKLEEPLKQLGRPDLSDPVIIEQAFELNFLRPPGWTPSQPLNGPTVRTWALDETLVLNRWSLAEAQETFGPTTGLYTLEQLATAILPDSTEVTDRAPATLAGMPALRLLFHHPGGNDRALYVARRGTTYYALFGPAPLVDQVACTARLPAMYPYTTEYVRTAFAVAGIILPAPHITQPAGMALPITEWEWQMDGLPLRLTLGEPEPQAPEQQAPTPQAPTQQWRAGNLTLYGAADAPAAVQEHLRTALAPLAAGRGRPVWAYGCSPAERSGPTTGGVATLPSRMTLCARTQPSTFTLLVPPEAQGRPVHLQFAASGSAAEAGESKLSVIWQWEGGPATRLTGMLPFEAVLPAVSGPGAYSVTVTGGEAVTIRILAPDDEP